MNTKAIASMWIFRRESNPKKIYQTLQYTDGSTSCECPGWKFKKKVSATGDRTCKHVRDIEAGTADMHAERKVEYSVTATRTPQRVLPPTPEPSLNFSRNRAINLEED